MKKNIFSVIITVLTVINVILTAIMFFVMMPTFQKTNNLITQVASVLNLDLSADSDADADADYTMADLEKTTISFDEDQTVNLKDSDDGKKHYAIFTGYQVSVNTKAEDYDNFKTEVITDNEAVITDIICRTLESHTMEEADRDLIVKEVLDQIQEKYDTKSIVSLTLSGYKKQ